MKSGGPLGDPRIGEESRAGDQQPSTMEAPGQYFSHPPAMYGRDYGQYTTLGGHYGQPQSTCVYAGKAPVVANYGPQTMSVVEHGLGVGAGLDHQGAGGMTPHHLAVSVSLTNPSHHSHTAMAVHPSQTAPHPAHLAVNPNHHSALGRAGAGGGGPPHHMGLPQTPSHQPPPAHTHPLRHENKQSNNNNNSSTQNNNSGQPTLHFPWMKTTKSHAHQWKANWAGGFDHSIDSTLGKYLTPTYQSIQRDSYLIYNCNIDQT